MELYSGIDLHSNNCVIAIIDNKGEAVLKKRIRNDISEIIVLLTPFRDKLQGTVVESTFNWYWLVDGLHQEGFKMHLANTTAIQQYSGLKHSNDTIDALWLAELLRLGILPEGYIYPKEQRAVRDLARKRMQMVSQRTRNLLSLQSLIARECGLQMTGNQVATLTDEKLKMLLTDQNSFLAGSSNLKIYQQINKEESFLEKAILRQIKLSNEFIKLNTVPGIGKILALTIMLETGDIKRFASAGNFASYCRCVKSERLSNGKKKGENNAKNGNRYLSWAFIEAAHFAVRYSPEMKRIYQRKKAKKGAVVAVKTVAHKLARACYYILRDGVDFDVNKLM